MIIANNVRERDLMKWLNEGASVSFYSFSSHFQDQRSTRGYEVLYAISYQTLDVINYPTLTSIYKFSEETTHVQQLPIFPSFSVGNKYFNMDSLLQNGR